MTRGDKLALADALRSECCGNDTWRGRLCGHHQAWADGYDYCIESLKMKLSSMLEEEA